MQESGCRLEHSSATKFRNHVMEGEWDKVGLWLPWLLISKHFERQGICDLPCDFSSIIYCEMTCLCRFAVIQAMVLLSLLDERQNDFQS